MPVNTPTKTNFLYQILLGSGRTYFYTNIAENQLYNGDDYQFIEIDHTEPVFSGDDEESEIDVTVKEVNPISDLFLLSPPPYEVKIKILEYDRDTDTAVDYYRGWIVRSGFNLEDSTVSFHLKTVWLFFERETFSDSLSALSRYSIFDPRSGVDVESLKIPITVTGFNNERDVLTVTGISDPDGWFDGGIFLTPDRDPRTILDHITVGADKKLTITHPYPQSILDVGFTAEIYPGDDLVYGTWAVKFGAQTFSGRAFGGWPFMPDRDPAVGGVT